MTWREVIYEYDGSFNGLLCCIYESYTQKELPTAILCRGESEPCLFATQTVTTTKEHASRVYQSLQKISAEVGPLLRRVYLTCLPDKELAIYRFVAKLYREGRPLLQHLTDDSYHPLLRAVRNLNGEVEQYRGFVRFSDIGGVLAAQIEPKNRVLPLLRTHFCQRCHNESFFIYDRTHHEALLYSDGKSVIVPLEDFTMVSPDSVEIGYRRLWRCFYDAIAIRGRENAKLRMTHMPKRYWAMMTEFQQDPQTIPPCSDAIFPLPDAPDVTPAPAILPARGQSVPASAL